MIFSKEDWNAMIEDLRGDATLEQCAEEAYSAPLYTVTHKRHVLPEGGTPNDFVSIGPYWWPDPEKADGLPWIRRDGETNPVFYEYDSDVIFNFTSDAGALILGGLANGRVDWLARAVEQLDSFFLNPATRMNPNIKFGQFVPGVASGRCFGIIDVKEVYWLFELVELMPFENGWTKEKLQQLKKWAGELNQWLLTDELGIEENNTFNNHAISYDCMVAALAMFAGDAETARRQLQERSIPRIATQFDPDGSMPLELERTDSKGYSVFALMCFMEAGVLARTVGVDFPQDMLRRALTWLDDNIYSPNWKWRQIVPFSRCSPLLYQFAGMLFNDKSLLAKAKEESVNTWDTMMYWRKKRNVRRASNT